VLGGLKVDDFFGQVHVGRFPDFSGPVLGENGRSRGIHLVDRNDNPGRIGLLQHGPAFFEPVGVHIGDIVGRYVYLLAVGIEGRQG
jgi:hypothetical protein